MVAMKNYSVAPELFGLLECGFPLLMDNETLYSWCARFHRLACLLDARSTAKLLFGDVRIKNIHDFPGNIEFLCHATNGKLGSIDNLLLKHTMLSFYKPFLSSEIYLQIRAAMLAGEVSVVHRRLGLGKCGWLVPAPLKICPKCMIEDESEYQVAYWHHEHQWPSVHVCSYHCEPLLIAHDFLHQNSVHGWWLPRDVPNSGWHYPKQLSFACKNTLIDLSQWTSKLILWDGVSLTDNILRFCYLLQAKKSNLVALDGSLRFQILCNDFWGVYQCIANQPGMEFIQNTKMSQGGFLMHLIRNYKGRRHPIKHILMMNFLYDDPSQFFLHFVEVHDVFVNDGVDGVRRMLLDTRRKVREMITEQGLSLNAVASSIGLTTGVIVRFAKQSGIEYRRRPRLLTKEKEFELNRLLADGEKLPNIAKVLDLSVKYIRAYLTLHPDLRKIFQIRMKGRDKLIRRLQFMNIMDINPNLPIKRIRKIPGNGFEWLYRNDIEWLKQYLPKIWSR